MIFYVDIKEFVSRRVERGKSLSNYTAVTEWTKVPHLS